MNPYLLAGALDGLIAFVLAIPAIILEIAERGKVDLLPYVAISERRGSFAKSLSRYEVFLVALIIHVVIGFAFGFVYVGFVRHGWLLLAGTPFSFLSLIVYAVLAFIAAGLILFPALGLGLFGRKESKYVWMELLVSMLINGIGLWLIVQWFWPWFFAG